MRISDWSSDVCSSDLKIFQEDTGRAEGDIALGLLAETLPQALAAAVVGEGEELRLVEADERSLQHAGKAEIVVRQQQHAAERDQVHHGELLGEAQDRKSTRLNSSH